MDNQFEVTIMRPEVSDLSKPSKLKPAWRGPALLRVVHGEHPSGLAAVGTKVFQLNASLAMAVCTYTWRKPRWAEAKTETVQWFYRFSVGKQVWVEEKNHDAPDIAVVREVVGTLDIEYPDLVRGRGRLYGKDS